MTKSELREMIRECLHEELSTHILKETVEPEKLAVVFVGGRLRNTKAILSKITEPRHILVFSVRDFIREFDNARYAGFEKGLVKFYANAEGMQELKDTLAEVPACISEPILKVTTLLEGALTESTLTAENIFEGIFDSKATKQKEYNQIIADAFDKKAPAAIASQIASLAERALSETIDSFDETNVTSTKTAAKNFIIAIEAAKANAKKTPYGILTSIISHVQKYNRNAMGLDELVEFKRTCNTVQSHEKNGQKAIYYLMEILNKQLITRLDKTIAFLKKEYSI